MWASSTFVPKPQTPFQWVACDTRENILAKQDLLRRELRDRNIKLSWTKPEDTLLEAWLSRGDRKLAEVIYSAWKNGAKFDAWNEHRQYRNLDGCLRRTRSRSLPSTPTARAGPMKSLPGITSPPPCAKNFLFQDFRQSLEGQIRVDCRLNCFACGILPTFADLRRDHPGEGWKCPEVKSPKRASDQPSSHQRSTKSGRRKAVGGRGLMRKSQLLARLLDEREEWEDAKLRRHDTLWHRRCLRTLVSPRHPGAHHGA